MIKSFDEQLKLLKEELNKSPASLPDEPTALFRKIKVAFPAINALLEVTSQKIIHGNIIFLKCKNFNVYFKRSGREYSKLDVLVKKDGQKVDSKEGVFFEDFQRTVVAMTKNHTTKLTEYEVGDLDRIKSSSKLSGPEKDDKQKIGTNSSSIKNVASSMSSAMQAVDGYPEIQKDIINNANEKFEDLDKTINTGSFRTAVGDSKLYGKIKKAYQDNKNKKKI